jgi:ribosomal-protein-alanine N-acetyltransferase
MVLRIREFTPVDLNAILSLEKECFDKDAFDKDIFLEFYETEPYGFLVGEYNDKLIGYVIISTRRNTRNGEIISIAVSPEYRKRGIGSSLLKKSLEVLKSKNVENVRLIVRKSNMIAQNFYRKHKFEEVEFIKNYYKNEDGIIMRKKI